MDYSTGIMFIGEHSVTQDNHTRTYTERLILKNSILEITVKQKNLLYNTANFGRNAKMIFRIKTISFSNFTGSKNKFFKHEKNRLIELIQVLGSLKSNLISKKFN